MCRMLAAGLPPAEGAAVLTAISYEVDEPDRMSAVIRAATDADPRLRSLLALWGRRLVGESLSMARGLIQGRALLGELARRACVASGGNARDHLAWAMSELTAEHTRRMDRMGLAA
jgi:hypothetical protein